MRPPTYGQGIVVSVGVAVAVFVLAFMALGTGDGDRIPLAQTTTPLFWGLATLVVAAAGAGAQIAERNAALAATAVGRPRPDNALATAWTIPVVSTFAAIFLVATYHSRTMMIAGPAIAFFGTAGGLLSRDLLDDAADAAYRTATTIHTLVIHAIAFLALSAVYLNKLHGAIAVPLVGLISGLLVLETLERANLDKQRRILYAVLGGVALGEAMMALNWWPTHGWTGGAVLLVCFYLAAGVLLARAQRLTPRGRDLLEFGLVSLVALAILAFTA
jgi:hypothetical protein